MSKPTIWVDVTVILRWTGSFTGIQRATHNYIQRLELDETVNLKLFCFDHFDFKEVFYVDVCNTIISNSSTAENDTLDEVSTKRLKNFVKTTPLVGPIIHKAYRTLRYINVLVMRVVKKLKRSGVGAIFSVGDKVLLIDGNWDDLNIFARSLSSVKKLRGIEIQHIVHDVTAVRNPAYVHPSAPTTIGGYLDIMLPIIDKLFTISRSTMNDIEEYCFNSRIRLTNERYVIRLGDDVGVIHDSKRTTPKSMKKIVKDDKFLLTVGTIEVRKNHKLLYYMYKLAFAKGIELPKLIVAGRIGWLAEETIELMSNDSDISDKITILNNVSDDELGWLYNNCLLTLFPSFYEGWGLPVVESLAYGKLCIASNTSSIPEAGGELAAYASPFDPNEWVNQIKKYIDEGTLTIVEKKIRNQHKLFTWDTSYSELRKYL